MLAAFTFKVSDLIAKPGLSNQWGWAGRCKAEIETEIEEGFLLNRLDAELSVVNFWDFYLGTHHIISNFYNQPAALELEQKLAAAQAQKDDTSDDAMMMTYHPKGENVTTELLGITVGLQPQKYELWRAFLTLHFGRPDLIGRISCSWSGFALPSISGVEIPNESEFLKQQRPYLILGDVTFAFSAKPLP
jgi:hypothetical protein